MMRSGDLGKCNRWIVVWIVFCLLCTPTPAQDVDTIILQMVMHEALTTSPTMRQAIADFESSHEGVQVRFVADNRAFGLSSSGISLDPWRDYLSKGDVVTIESGSIGPELTRAGYLLDLQPLYTLDSLGSATSYPIAADTFVWDGGRWGVPVTMQPTVLAYDDSAFDAIGLTAPHENWTLDDLLNWASALAPSTDGPVIAVDEQALPMFLRYLIGSNLYDANAVPIQPNFQAAGVADTLESLRELQASGLLVVRSFGSGETNTPVRVTSLGWVRSPYTALDATIGLTTTSFVASGGTAYPELTYQLITYLVQHPAIAANFGGWPVYADSTSELFYPGYQGDPPVDLTDTLPYSATLFAHYLTPLLQSEDVRLVSEALLDAEILAQSHLGAAAARQSETLVVNPPRILPSPDDGITIRFGVFTRRSPLPTQRLWEATIEDFIVEDPEVSQILLEAVFAPVMDTAGMVQQHYDCFYTPLNLVPLTDFDSIRSISPLIASDPTMDRDDFLGQSLAQVSRDNQIWALPIDIKPLAMWIRGNVADASGFQPGDGWTTEAFFSVLTALQETASDDPLMIPYNSKGTHLMLLIYAFGGMPFDYREYPPTINFTAPETVEAVRTTIELVENGTLDYVSPVTSPGDSFGMAPIITAPFDDRFTYNGRLILMSSSRPGDNDTYRPFPFPRGHNHTAISYELGTAYISAETELIEPCYRFLSHISGDPTLFASMPARQSVLDSAEQGTMRAAEELLFYQDFAQLSQMPNTMVVPPIGHTITDEFERRHAFYQAFDAVIFDGVDLEVALRRTEENAQEYQHCIDRQATVQEGVQACNPSYD